MKKALILLGIFAGVAALAVWVASWFWAPEKVATAAAQPWPSGLGTLDSIAKRYPKRPANAASAKLAELGGKLPESDVAGDYVRVEITKDSLAIGEPPALPDITAIRDLLLREKIVWSRDVGGDPGSEVDGAAATRGPQMRMARALVANALVRARANDLAAWDDLHAAWNLARALDGHPIMNMRTAAMSMARMINGVAWKMPLPAPAWFDEVTKHDEVRPLLEGYQHQTASYWQSYAGMFPTKPMAETVERHRQIAEQLARVTQCDVKNIPINEWGPDLTTVWQRGFRYRAEREATANALRVRSGQPIEPKSQCSDGGWTLDGTTLRFSRAIPSTDPRDAPMPLTLNVK